MNEWTATKEALRTRDTHPEDFPNLNFHHNRGSFLTHKNPISASASPPIVRYWHLYTQNPTLVNEHYIQPIQSAYRATFRSFFVADSLSIHGHVSDASKPLILIGLNAHIYSHATNGVKGLSDKARENPLIAITEGYYGVGFGPLQYHAISNPQPPSEQRPSANGAPPIMLRTDDACTVEAQVRDPKGMECVAVIAQMVRSLDGRVIGEDIGKEVVCACDKYNLFLVVDETMTSIRCGASFSYQLPQYHAYGSPDLVLFGKAVKRTVWRLNGVVFNVQKLGIGRDDQRKRVISDWQNRFADMASVSDLLIFWGTILLAGKEDWPLRAREVGQVLRDMQAGDGLASTGTGGLHSLIYMPWQDATRFSWPVMGANAGDYVRWLPVLDEIMTSPDRLREKVLAGGVYRIGGGFWHGARVGG
ncbi:MAG: hypothetical protein Q9194_001614 [Teloschistes cf. exilis]